eukprot:31298-Pelagococcus_subviridis.AAC.4
MAMQIRPLVDPPPAVAPHARGRRRAEETLADDPHERDRDDHAEAPAERPAATRHPATLSGSRVHTKRCRGGVERRQKRRTLGGERRRAKSLRNGVHHADAAVWGPVLYRTHLSKRAPAAHRQLQASLVQPRDRVHRVVDVIARVDALQRAAAASLGLEAMRHRGEAARGRRVVAAAIAAASSAARVRVARGASAADVPPSGGAAGRGVRAVFPRVPGRAAAAVARRRRRRRAGRRAADVQKLKMRPAR